MHIEHCKIENWHLCQKSILERQFSLHIKHDFTYFSSWRDLRRRLGKTSYRQRKSIFQTDLKVSASIPSVLPTSRISSFQNPWQDWVLRPFETITGRCWTSMSKLTPTPRPGNWKAMTSAVILSITPDEATSPNGEVPSYFNILSNRIGNWRSSIFFLCFSHTTLIWLGKSSFILDQSFDFLAFWLHIKYCIRENWHLCQKSILKQEHSYGNQTWFISKTAYR